MLLEEIQEFYSFQRRLRNSHAEDQPNFQISRDLWGFFEKTNLFPSLVEVEYTEWLEEASSLAYHRFTGWTCCNCHKDFCKKEGPKAAAIRWEVFQNEGEHISTALERLLDPRYADSGLICMDCADKLR
jgi:hypothetical protein